MGMSRYSVEIKWNVSELNEIKTQDLKDIVVGNSVDEVLEREIEKLCERYNSFLKYETYAQHNSFKRHERFFHEGRFVGIITVAVETP